MEIFSDFPTTLRMIFAVGLVIWYYLFSAGYCGQQEIVVVGIEGGKKHGRQTDSDEGTVGC
jgi:hypothetical protein